MHRKVSISKPTGDIGFDAKAAVGIFISSTGNLIGATVIKNNDNLLLIGNTSICIAATEVPLLSRIAIGNIMIKTKNLKSIVKI